VSENRPTENVGHMSLDQARSLFTGPNAGSAGPTAGLVNKLLARSVEVPPIRFISLNGLVPYKEAQELQLKLVELRAHDLIPDTILFLEHTPVITRGRGLQFTGEPRPRHMPAPPLIPEGMDFVESERGGDLTYHGPGQLVIYPICKLDGKGFGPNHDIGGFLRTLESLIIAELAERGLSAETRPNATGVWIGDKKIASIGIAVRKWVTYHGIAINCTNDLKPFFLISPCGFAPEVMTKMDELVTQPENWRADFEQRLVRRIQMQSP